MTPVRQLTFWRKQLDYYKKSAFVSLHWLCDDNHVQICFSKACRCNSMLQKAKDIKRLAKKLARCNVCDSYIHSGKIESSFDLARI